MPGSRPRARSTSRPERAGRLGPALAVLCARPNASAPCHGASLEKADRRGRGSPPCSRRARFPSGTTYTPNETGTVMRVEDARVVSSREVKISGLDNQQAAGWGTAIGAALAGTTAYGITKANNPADVAITVVAAIVGGLAGLAAEEFRETRQRRRVHPARRQRQDQRGRPVAGLGREDLSARNPRLADLWRPQLRPGRARSGLNTSAACWPAHPCGRDAALGHLGFALCQGGRLPAF